MPARLSVSDTEPERKRVRIWRLESVLVDAKPSDLPLCRLKAG